MADGGKENIENFVLVINCSKCFSTEEFIKQIIKDNFSTQKLSDGLRFHPWRIENKYYCADIKFLVVPSQDEKPAWLNSKELQITAGVILFDKIQSSFETAKEWVNYLESEDAEAVLLVGSKNQQSTSNDEKKKDSSTLSISDVLEFSIKHSLEFIDLNEEIDPEDDFPDTVGFARIDQALQAIEWPDLQMKGQATTGNKSDSKSNEKTEITSENKTADVDVSQSEFETLHDLFDGIVDEADLEADEPSFDKLFQRMKLMKEKAENLPHTERKAYAEQVAVAFWKAIGGDEDEIEDLDLQ